MAKDSTKKAVKEATTVKSLEEMEQELITKRNDLLEAKRANKAGELVNPRAITAYRKDIARLMTQINERKSNG